MKYNSDSWKNLIQLFTSLSKVGFTDVVIRNKSIREINSAKNLICNIKNIDSVDTEFQMVKNYLSLFASFTPEEDKTVEVDCDKTYNYIRDNVSEVKILRPDMDLLSCEYLQDSRFNKLQLDKQKVLLEENISQSIINKINVVSELFASSVFVLDSNNGKTKLKIDSWKKSGSSRLLTIDSSIKAKELKGNINLFRFGFDDVTLKVTQAGNNYMAITEGSFLDFTVSLYSKLNT